VALVGFDEFALADKLTPPVTVVAQDTFHAISLNVLVLVLYAPLGIQERGLTGLVLTRSEVNGYVPSVNSPS
jgi:hypothetical protein